MEDATVTAMTAIKAGVTSIIGMVPDVFTAITSNELLAVYVGAGLLAVVIGLFARMKSVAR